MKSENTAGMKSVALRKLVGFLDSELKLSEFPKDESVNGLQVEGSAEVHKIGLAVDACDYIFQSASERNIDFLIVHHGLIWGGIRSVSGTLKKRIRTLLDSDISLYACHLPLDWHPEYGNNARLLELLSIKRRGGFGQYHGKRIGYWGSLNKDLSLSDFMGRVDKILQTRTTALGFGRRVRKIGIVSGGGWSAIYDAEKTGIDTLLVGEPSHSAYTLAEEMKLNVVFAGHYATETVGVKAVGNMLAGKYGLKAEFIDHPTGL